ncbi:hypothetical protein H1N79_gp59 [Escherichia phage tonn]|uniref:Uncharacterized protein n=2 Tax=Warwickvirus TaxID=2732068 RepID=A0A6B9WZ84_9CAUD|nr:hypothetical protein H1N79_gp59 [Escherichia phage tonn]YP_009965961.1 hypothetical protein HOS92_gp80 [Escherichia phage SECphi27]QHR67360.1 hypothetical protein ityhuna_58 [Escherichia phage ityhuna]QHR69090.1 hypothetical protein tonn_59 [Escherichia phage tonn]UGO55882.1 hypothetical protein JLBYU01_89 [Escherichia phage JLBYU01]
MRDLTLKFVDKAEFSAFIEKIEWKENENIQNAILLDVIGTTYTVVARSDDGDEIAQKNDGYFVNVRIIDNKFDSVIFNDYVVELDQPIREWA